jgi:hypothetical protein
LRIWSLHPKYLDAKGLVALWRETLLARQVLEGKTKGYRHHPQLIRFRGAKNPLDAINYYLSEVYLEAQKRNYHFDREKIDWAFKKSRLTVTSGQMDFEKKHLLQKLKNRDYNRFKECKKIAQFDSHSIFKIVDGAVEEWEIVKRKFGN